VQLLLPVTINSSQTFSSFVTPENVQNVMTNEISRAVESDDFVALYLAGSDGSGKTHLLTSCCHHANEVGKSSMLLPLEQVVDSSPDLILGLENVEVVCVDNIEAISNNREWETAIFNLFNALQQNNATIIFTALDVPTKIQISLPDLASRLQWGTLFQIPTLSEQDKSRALVQHAHFMGFELTEDVAKFMLNRLPRKMSFLMQALNTLAKQSIEKQRKVTVPFVKHVLEI